jgi:tetratricopeptide (TPR) repeat protein
VPAISRGQIPPGPVTELYERLDELHLTAGLPSMRDISTGAGQGQVSPSTVHNVFRFHQSRVPQWFYLEKIVSALGGDTAVFQRLWQAASQAENSHRAVVAGPPGAPKPGPVPVQRFWSNEVPHRNDDFTGRVAELGKLSANLAGHDGRVPAIQVISGIGGIGKTELATEFIHHSFDQYEIIWWIRAEHHDRVRDALVDLGQRLELREAVTDSGRDRIILAVLEALGSGARASWLLVYDNAAQPPDLLQYMPPCRPGGHIIVTTRLPNWPGYRDKDSIQVSPFTKDEAADFLRRRVPGLTLGVELSPEEITRRSAEAERLADALGYLPIAIDHATAYLRETGQTVGDYLSRFDQDPHLLLSEQPADFSGPVSATWAVSSAVLTADAQHLFNLCAFFSPEPIAADIFLDNADAVDDSFGLREFLASSPRFHAAASLLHRLSLAKVDGARDQIQMHRVVQAVTRGRLRQNGPGLYQAYRAAVEALLAASNPGNPDRGGNDAAYDLSLQHLESDRNFLKTSSPDLRRLIIDQVRRLHLRGGHVESVQFGQDALRTWRDRLGWDDLQVLTLAVEVAIALRFDGRAADAGQLTLDTLTRLRNNYGDEHEIALFCANNYGADLRGRGQFGEALDLDRGLLPKCERVLGPDHERTLNVQNNLAEDYRRLGRFRPALDLDERTFEARLRILGHDDLRTLFSHDAVSRDKRGLGRYQESLDIARRVVRAFDAVSGRENRDWLYARAGFATALRKVGYYWDALQESEDVVHRYRDYLGPDHIDALRAAANLINDRRAVGDLAGAGELGREVLDRCRETDAPFDIGYAAQVNLASVLRADGRPREALRYDLQARAGLIGRYGDAHPFTLAASINYAADLAACDDLAAAVRIGQETMTRCHGSLGDEHPDTQLATSNLAIDLMAFGNHDEADRLAAAALGMYEQTLTAEHPVVRDAVRRIRITAEIDLSPD